EADLGIDQLAALEVEQARYGIDLEASAQKRALVAVDLDDLHFVAPVRRHLVQEGTEETTGRAPLGPEVDDHDTIGAEDDGIEIRVTGMENGCFFHVIPLSFMGFRPG